MGRKGISLILCAKSEHAAWGLLVYKSKIVSPHVTAYICGSPDADISIILITKGFVWDSIMAI